MKKYCDDYKISVIVPIFRVEDYLHRCIDSIIHQTYTNLEIILVDDGSDDKCAVICDGFALFDNRIKVIHKENGGLSSARNIGLGAATGQFIAFVDPDDYINHHMYKNMMDQLIEHDADIVMCDFQYVYSDSSQETLEKDIEVRDIEVFDGHKAQYLMCEDYISRVIYTVAWNKLYKKELFEGIKYPEGRIHEDEARTYELLYKAKTICYLKEPFYYYFQRPDGIVYSNENTLNKLQLIDAYVDRLVFYRKNHEFELWGKEAVHAMRTYCRLQYELEETGMETDYKELLQYKSLVDELMVSKKKTSLSIRLAIEISMFCKRYDLYYGLFRNKRRISNT